MILTCVELRTLAPVTESPLAKVTVLSVEVEAALLLPAASVALLAAIEAVTVPGVVTPSMATS